MVAMTKEMAEAEMALQYARRTCDFQMEAYVEAVLEGIRNREARAQEVDRADLEL